jgi:hypothetical protein
MAFLCFLVALALCSSFDSLGQRLGHLPPGATVTLLHVELILRSEFTEAKEACGRKEGCGRNGQVQVVVVCAHSLVISVAARYRVKYSYTV